MLIPESAARLRSWARPRAHSVHALRAARVREGLSRGRDLPGGRRRGGPNLGSLHRLPLLHGGMSLRPSLLQLDRARVAWRRPQQRESRRRASSRLAWWKSAPCASTGSGRFLNMRASTTNPWPMRRSSGSPLAPPRVPRARSPSATWPIRTPRCRGWPRIRAPCGFSARLGTGPKVFYLRGRR